MPLLQIVSRSISRNNKFIIAICAVLITQVVAYRAGHSIIIPKGKYLDVRFISDIHPENINVGDIVEMETAVNLVVDTTIVVPEHHPVRAIVFKVQRHGPFGRPDIIAVKIDHIKMSGNVTIPLKGEYQISGQQRQAESLGITVAFCLCGIFIPGDKTYIKADTIVPCFVAADVNIELN